MRGRSHCFEEVGGSLDDVTGDYRTRTSAIHTALEAMTEAGGDCGAMRNA